MHYFINENKSSRMTLRLLGITTSLVTSGVVVMSRVA